MTSPDPDPAATLEAIRDRAGVFAKLGPPRTGYDAVANAAFASAADVPGLVAALDAVLKLHQPVDRGRVMRCCEGCEAVNGEFHEDCCHEWPCPAVEAITRALKGGEQCLSGSS